MDKPTITLAKNKCYVDGQWIGEPTLPVTNKATGDIMARVPELRRGGDARSHRGGQPRPAGLVEDAGQGPLQARAPLVRPDRRERRRAGAAAHQRAGQAAGRGQGRDPLCRRLHRVLRRGGQAHLRRDHPDLQGRRAHRRHQAAGRRGGGHHAVELPRRHDHAQGRARRWRSAAPMVLQAGLRDAADRAGAGRAGRARRASPRACSTSSPARPA